MAGTNYLNRTLTSWKMRRNRRRILLIDDLDAGYVPVTKVASTSIRRRICKRQAARQFPDLEGLSGVRLQAQVERRIRISASVGEALDLGEQRFLFAFVRNPLTRLYSCYLDKVVVAANKGRPCTLAPWGVSAAMSFEDFVRCIAAIPDDQADQHFRSQYPLLWYRDQWLVDSIGHFESLDEDWEVLAAKIGLDQLPGRQRSSGAGDALRRLPLSADVAGLAVQRYRQDIDLFGYREEIDRWLAGLH